MAPTNLERPDGNPLDFAVLAHVIEPALGDVQAVTLLALTHHNGASYHVDRPHRASEGHSRKKKRGGRQQKVSEVEIEALSRVKRWGIWYTVLLLVVEFGREGVAVERPHYGFDRNIIHGGHLRLVLREQEFLLVYRRRADADAVVG